MASVGFDTETFKGQVKLLAASSGAYIETDNTDDLLSFLYEHSTEEAGGHNVFWNIAFDFGCIMRQYLFENSDALRRNHYRSIRLRSRIVTLLESSLDTPTLASDLREMREELDSLDVIQRLHTARFAVKWVVGKAFSLQPLEGGSQHYFFDAANFYSAGFGGTTLESAGQHYLGRGKTDSAEGVDRRLIGEREGYYGAHRAAIIRYCIEDCRLTAALMDRTIEGFRALGLNFPPKPYSKASVSKQFFKDSGTLRPTQEVCEYFTKVGPSRYWEDSYRGGVFLNRAIGTFQNVFAIDINSAYPDAMRYLPSLEGAYFVRTDDSQFDSFACYFRFYKVLTQRGLIAPSTTEATPNRLVYSAGRTEEVRFVTEPDLRLMELYGHPHTIVGGVGIVVPDRDTRPLQYVENIYADKSRIKREYGEDSIEYWNVKVFLNGGYGILAQSRPRPGAFTNLIYASYITAMCREKLLTASRSIEAKGGRVMSYATDGLLTDTLPPDLPVSDKLGEWGVKRHKEVTLFESGVYVVDGRLKKRGMPTLTVEQLRTTNSRTLTVYRRAPMKLMQGLIRRKVDRIGDFHRIKATLAPAKALTLAGLVVPPRWERAPLRDYFTDGEYLQLDEAE